MLNKFAEKHLVSAASGDVINLDELGDKFSRRIYGDGYALMPDSGIIYAPASGVISDVSSDFHMITLRTGDGVTIVVRIGVDGIIPSEHIISYVCSGDAVDRGQIIAMVDMSELPSYARHSVMPIIITNIGTLKSYSVCESGHLTGGKSIALRYTL